MKQSLTPEISAPILAKLKAANQAFTAGYPGNSPDRQPVHTVYGGAHLFSRQVAKKMGDAAVKMMKATAPNGKALAQALGQTFDQKGSASNEALWNLVHMRVMKKLEAEAVEDFRIDFEDGYGNRPDVEEDGHAAFTAAEVAAGMKENSLPPFIGIRVKTFNEENIARGMRTLDIFLSTLLAETNGKLPNGFVVTLPKINITEQSRALAKFLSHIELKNKMKNGEIKFEIMVETPQSIFDSTGRTPLKEIVASGEGRVIGAHFGTYDYTAGCDITAAYQAMMNPVCDFAKHVMQVSLAGSGVFLSDGATNIMPVGPHRAEEGQKLTAQQMAENEAVIFNSWRLSYSSIRHSLETGFYQGWDLHPAQLPIRYATVYAFFLETLDAASNRLKAFMDKAAKATLLGDVFDDAATGQGLLNFFLRGLACGAVTIDEVARTGLTVDDLRTRSFLKILQRRQAL